MEEDLSEIRLAMAWHAYCRDACPLRFPSKEAGNPVLDGGAYSCSRPVVLGPRVMECIQEGGRKAEIRWLLINTVPISTAAS